LQTTVEDRTFDGDGVMRAVTITDPAGAAKTWSMTWDPTRPNGEVLSWQSAGQRTSFLYGNERAASMNATGLQSYEYSPLGDIIAGRAGTVESSGYTPYGKGETQNLTVEPRFGYRGEIQIGNRVHLRARDLNTTTARFDRKDPLAGIPGETVETNQYHYANNDPIGQTDPSGLQPTDQTFALPKPKAIHVLGAVETKRDCGGFFGSVGCLAGDVYGGFEDAVTGPVKLVYRPYAIEVG
jgi:RHS repeat-associated protein